MRSSWWAALALVGLAVTGCGAETGTPPEHGAQGPTRAYVIHGAGTLPTELDPAAYPDAPLLARTSHRTLDETMRMLAVQQLYGDAVTQVRRQYRAVFASEGVEGDGHFVVFTDAPSPEGLSVFETLPFDTVVYSGAPATTAQLERLMEASGNLLKHRLGKDPAMEWRILHDGSGVEIRYNPGDLTGAELDAAEQADRESLRQVYGSMADLVSYVRDPEFRGFTAE